jgi:hypothetical protein
MPRQRERPDRWVQVWAEVDPSAPKEKKTVVILGTGDEIPQGLFHVGTFKQEAFMWHVYAELI